MFDVGVCTYDIEGLTLRVGDFMLDVLRCALDVRSVLYIACCML